MASNFHIFIIEDHPLITEAYSAAIEHLFGEAEKKWKISSCHNIDCAIKKIGEEKFLSNVDLIILDIQLPIPFIRNSQIISGEDLGIKIRRLNPSIKIMVSTSLDDNHRIRSILKSLNPEGFLVKNDINKKELLVAIDKVIFEPPYYSSTVLQYLRKAVNTDIVLDVNDRKLLYELSIGTKLRDLQKVLPLSLGGIERKRRNLKLIFDVGEDDGDRALVLKAKEKGFIYRGRYLSTY